MDMEKYYCEHCCILSNQEESCSVCGSVVQKKIIIEVQKQKSSSLYMTEQE